MSLLAIFLKLMSDLNYFHSNIKTGFNIIIMFIMVTCILPNCARRFKNIMWNLIKKSSIRKTINIITL